MLAKIAEMPESDRAMAERLHAIIKASTLAENLVRDARVRLLISGGTHFLRAALIERT